jgi:hypothetical protein
LSRLVQRLIIKAKLECDLPVDFPDTFGQYSYVKTIGCGSSAVVILAEHIPTKTHFACKIVPREQLDIFVKQTMVFIIDYQDVKADERLEASENLIVTQWFNRISISRMIFRVVAQRQTLFMSLNLNDVYRKGLKTQCLLSSTIPQKHLRHRQERIRMANIFVLLYRQSRLPNCRVQN